VIAWQPVAGLLGLVWAIGVWAIIVGVLKIALALRARRYVREPSGTRAAA
jgi:uncharacterized membrane protein HdeD (DUF308 family)